MRFFNFLKYLTNEIHPQSIIWFQFIKNKLVQKTQRQFLIMKIFGAPGENKQKTRKKYIRKYEQIRINCAVCSFRPNSIQKGYTEIKET